MHHERLTRPARLRAGRAPLRLAFVIALAALVAPVGLAGRPALAVPRPGGAGAGPAGQDMAAAESSLVAMINADRAAVGLRPLRVDGRLSAVAEARSASMAAAGQLSHVQSDGRTMVDLITAAGIRWFAAGETIGWNTYPSLGDSTRAVNAGWMGSPEHAAIVRSAAYNYLGIGLGRTARGDRYWTAVFLRGPDRTPPWARMQAPAAGSLITLASRLRARQVTWEWGGDDRPLAVLTSGLRSFQVQRRIDGGTWVTVVAATTSRHWSSPVWVGHRFSVRVRARDNAGNVGGWSTPISFSA